jgi:ABC-type transporter Mla MlaB component
VSEPRDPQIAQFVESLSPHQRVVLQRLLGECLTVVPRSTEETTIEHLRLVDEGVRPLVELLATLREYAPAADDDSDIRPFALSVPEPGHVLVRLSRKILTWTAIWEEKAHNWLKDVRVQRLTVDVSRLEELNSSTIAWLVTLAQKVPGGRLTLRGANETMRRALGVLHLEQILCPEKT